MQINDLFVVETFMLPCNNLKCLFLSLIFLIVSFLYISYVYMYMSFYIHQWIFAELFFIFVVVIQDHSHFQLCDCRANK